MKKVLRIVVSPIIFLFIMAMLFCFPAWIGLIGGGVTLLGYIFKGNVDKEEVKLTLEMTFMFIVMPCIITKLFIQTGKLGF